MEGRGGGGGAWKARARRGACAGPSSVFPRAHTVLFAAAGLRLTFQRGIGFGIGSAHGDASF